MFNTKEPVTSKGRAAWLVSWLMLRLAFTDGLKYRVWKLAERRMSRFDIEKCDKVTELCAWYGYMRNEYPAEAFRSAVYKPFEGHMLPLPAGHDAAARTQAGHGPRPCFLRPGKQL